MANSNKESNQTKSQALDLTEVRAKIDGLDRDMVRILSERASLAQAAARAKQAEHGKDAVLFRPEREAQLLREVIEQNPGPLSDSNVQHIISEVVSACRALELPLSAAFLGPKGTYTESATVKYFGSCIRPVSVDTIDAVFREVASGNCDFGVVPVENSTEGVVTHTLDTFLSSSLKICGEVLVPIHHCMISASAAVSDIKIIYSHSQSLAQCRKWLDKHFPGVAREAVSSNAEAVRKIVGRSDAGAIAGALAAQVYEVPILQENIEDEPDNTTRFIVLGRQPVEPSGDDKTAVAFSFTKNRPGGLHKAIGVFSERNIDMTRIESRPSRTQRWNYVFYVDFAGHINDPLVAEALEELQSRTDFMKTLGSFPRAIPEED